MKELKNMQICIVGLGLMGGSLAMAIRDHVNAIVAVDIDEESLAKAEERAIVDIVTTDLRSGISNADVIILATPVRTILSTLKELANIDLTRKIVTDLGSTKKEICEAMDNLPSDVLAIGAHPMCGRELSGLAAARADLFQQKKVVLCRTKRTTDYAQSIISELFEATGTEIIFIDADLHDNLVALTSHMPYLLSGILTRQAAGAAEREGDVWEVAASGFADMSRLAGSNSSVMLDILATNRSSIASRLELYRSEIDQLIQMMKGDNESELLEWLRNVESDYAEYRQLTGQHL
jgi:prephenate dehydrogenase